MRILVISQYFYPENTPTTEIVKGLVKKGHQVTVVCGQPNYGFGRIVEGYEHVFEETAFGAKIIRVKLHPRNNPKSLKDLLRNYLTFYRNSRKRVRKIKEDFDIVYSFAYSPCISVSCGNLFAKKHKIKHIIHVADLWPESPVAIGAIKKDSFFYKILYHWSRNIFKKADSLLLSSPSFADYFHDVLKLDKPMQYLPLAASVGFSEPIEINWKHDINLVYCGNIGRLQMVEELVKAMALIKTDKDICLHIIGSGSSLPSCVSLVREYGLENKISIYGRVKADETAPYQEKADILIVPLRSDDSPVSKTIPNKLVTSMYYGRPILGIIAGDGKKVLEEAGGALFPASEDPKDIAKCIEEFLELDAKQKEKMGALNKLYYSDKFAFNRLMDQLISTLEKSVKKA